MGSNTSKSFNESTVHIEKKNTDADDKSDPRSPTPEITRTPVQGKVGSKHNITKNADLRKNFDSAKGEEKLIHNNPILSAVIKNHLQSYDPRSPTQEFERTPIIIPSKLDALKNDETILKHHTRNDGVSCLKNADGYDNCAEAQEIPELMAPKNLYNAFFNITLDDTIKDTDEPLGSSTGFNEIIENNISNENHAQPKHLLETNFDYVDTTLEEMEDSRENMQVSNVIDNAEGDFKKIPFFKVLNNDPRSPSTDIERTPIVVAKTDEESIEENVEEMSDDTLIKVLQNANTELRQVATKPQDNPEELLIYEDESTDLNVTPKKPKSGSNSGSRTPLSCMKNKDSAHMRSKSANPLVDSKDRKIARRVSHIPRLKSLSKQTKLNPVGSAVSLKNISKSSVISGDCENTPPHSHRDMWDKDISIVL